MKPLPFTDNQISSFRNDFPHLSQSHFYLNHAAFGVLSTKVNQSINRHLQERNSGIIESFPIDMNIIEETRAKIAQLINAPSPDNIAFITNTSEGINLIASGLDWKAGESVLLNDAEFPSNVYPYTNLRPQGVQIRFAPSANGAISAESIISAIQTSDQLVAVSAVQFLSGYKIDLPALGAACKNLDKWLIVDGIQAAGNSPIDVQAMGIDGFISVGLKWLMAPMGIGFVYMSDELLQALTPRHVGWLSVETPWDLFNYEQGLNPTARRYELGGLNVPGIYALHASLDPFLELGIDSIQKHLLSLTDRILHGLDIDNVTPFTNSDYAFRSGIMTFNLPQGIDGDDLIEKLRVKGVTISHRAGKLRFSPHFYNNFNDIDAAVEIVNSTTMEYMSRNA